MQPENQISITDKIVATVNTLAGTPPGEIHERLISLINELINTDFHALVQLLYRIDIDEKKLKQLVETGAGSDAAPIIADLIISRQLQKINTKKQFDDKKKPGMEDSW